MSRRRLVVATDDTQPSEHNERLLTMVAWFAGRGVDVEVVSIGDGWARDRIAAAAPLVVADEFRRRGPARPFWALGIEPAVRAIKSVRLRRWTSQHAEVPFLVLHPLAAGILRYARTPPRRIVAALPGPDWHLDDLRPDDRTTLSGACGWVVRTEDQRDEVRAATGAPVLVADTLVDPRTLVPVRPRPADGVVVVLTAADRWDTPDLAVELAWQLHRQDPSIRFRWVVSTEEAAWLTRHDVAHAGLEGCSELWREDRPGLLDGVSAVLRTTRESGGTALALAAALAGVPVLGWGSEDLTGATSAAPCDVEGVVATVLSCRADPGRAAAVPSLSHLNLDHHGEALLDLLFPGVPGPR